MLFEELLKKLARSLDEEGIEVHWLDGVSVRLYSPEDLGRLLQIPQQNRHGYGD